MSTKLTGMENAQMGMIGGALEVSSLQWTNYCKNAVQQGRSLTMDPRKLYRGYPSNLINMAACTMWQFAVCGQVSKLLTGGENRQLKPWEDITAGFAAGTSSGMVGGPLELIMIQQQVKGGSVVSAVREIGMGNIGRGFVPTAMREGMWAMGYLSFPPM